MGELEVQQKRTAGGEQYDEGASPSGRRTRRQGTASKKATTRNGSAHNTGDRQGHNSAPLHRKEGTGAHHDPYRDAPTQEQHPHGRTVPAAFRGLRVPGGYNDENIL